MVSFTVSSFDVVDGAVEVSCNHKSNGVFPVGKTIVSCSATDKAGNEATGTFVVNVENTTPPTITVPGNIVTTATSQLGSVVTYSSPTAVDIVDGTVPVICDKKSDSIFVIGTTTVTCTASDSSGNKDYKTFTVTVQNVPPTIITPGNEIVEATSEKGARVTFNAHSNDEVTCSPASGSEFPIAMTTVTCKALNKEGEAATKSFTVTVRDTIPPVLYVPNSLSATATSASGAIVTWTVSAHDNVDGNVAVVCNHDSGSTFKIGTTTVSCTASDRSGNRASRSFQVIITSPSCPGIQDRIWSTDPMAWIGCQRTSIKSNAASCLSSIGNGEYQSCIQNDGNIVSHAHMGLWGDGYGSGITWASGRLSNNGPFNLVMQSDGNLVEYDREDRPVWDSYSDPNTRSRAIGTIAPYMLIQQVYKYLLLFIYINRY